jgi:signal transduction histidine kinase
VAFDVGLAVVLAVVGVANAAMADAWWATAANRPTDGAGYALVAGTGLVLAVRRAWPLVTLAVATVLTSAYLIVAYPYSLVLLSFAVAVYTVARCRPLREALIASGCALLPLLVHLLTNSAALSGAVGLAPAVAWVAVPFAVGATRRMAAEAAARARAEVLRQRVDDERLRVAQEVHDIVGHGLAAIKMQADIALHVLRKRPEQAQTALDVISRTSGEALDELRTTLAVVRRTDVDDTRDPAPSLARVEQVRQRMAHAGLDVRVETTGTPRPLPVPVELAGYRIVQESLTNVLRHSDARTADVTLSYADDAVGITVTNTPPGGASGAARDGSGIAGMRRRVALLGGEFTAGSTEDGRFEVHAVLPTGGQR